MMDNVRVGEIEIGEGGALCLIAGPCVIEGRDHALRHAEQLARIARRLGLPLIYKSSYDKANRTSLSGFRGPGVEEGLRVLEAVRGATGLPVLTDVHQSDEVSAAAQIVDVLQVPAFLCRQTSLLEAAARTARPVNVKKGQFLSPVEAGHIVEKIRAVAGPGRCLITERGTTFGYHNLIVDFRALPLVKRHGVPVVFDASHSVQRPGAGADGASTGGEREFIPVLAAAAVAAGANAIFMEVHEDPDAAPCDAPNMLPLAELEPLLRRLIRLRAALEG